MQALRVSPYMDRNECAAYLGVKPGTIYQWVHERKIPARKHGGKLMFHQQEIDEWSASQRKKAPEAAQSKFQSARNRLRALSMLDVG